MTAEQEAPVTVVANPIEHGTATPCNGLLTESTASAPLAANSKCIHSGFHFQHVNYTTNHTGKTANSPTATITAKTSILKDVCGSFRRGRLTAILGPSGAGKTSLLNVLAGFKTKNVCGEFVLNGQHALELAKLRQVCAYIPQDFVMLHLLSVMETLRSAADLKLARGTTDSAKLAIITNILQLLNLQDCQHTLVRHLSGGERKRLSIGVELVTNPPLMFFDEPTSGLDSVASLQVIEHLNDLAHNEGADGGRIVVCVVHQPSSRLMQLFDDVLVMCHGEVLYCGAQSDLLGHFERAGSFICPAYYNPADFVLEVGSKPRGAQHDSLIEQNKVFHAHSLQEGAGKSHDVTDQGGVVHCGPSNNKSVMIDTAKYTSGHEMIVEMATMGEEEQSTLVTPRTNKVTVFEQFLLLLSRSFRAMSRHLLGVQLRIVMHILVAILLGVVFWDIGDDGSRVLTNFSCIFFLVMFVFFANAMPSILLCPQDMAVFLREYLNGWYTLRAYYLAKITSELPMLFICPTFFMSIVYFMTGQPADMGRFVMCWGVGLLTGVIGHMIGLIFGSSCHEQMAIFLVPATTIPFLIFSGFFIRLDEMVWLLRPLCDISFFRYTIEGFMQAIYGYDRADLPCPVGKERQCFYTSPVKFLTDLSMWGDFYGRDIAALLAWIAALLALFYLSLWWRIKSAR